MKFITYINLFQSLIYRHITNLILEKAIMKLYFRQLVRYND